MKISQLKIIQLLLVPFGFFFGANGLWKTLLFPERSELGESAEERRLQIFYIVRPIFAVPIFLLVWMVLARGVNKTVSILTAYGLLDSFLGSFVLWLQRGADAVYRILSGINKWISDVFSPIQFLFPYNITFHLSAIGIYIACYHLIKRSASRWLKDLGAFFLGVNPNLDAFLKTIYQENPVTKKVTLSPQWARIKERMGLIVSANIILFYILNVRTNFATEMPDQFPPIHLLTFAGFFCLMEIYHYLSLADTVQNKNRRPDKLDLIKLRIAYQQYAEKKQIGMRPSYQNPYDFRTHTIQETAELYQETDNPTEEYLYHYLQERRQVECMELAVHLVRGENVFYASPFYKDIDGCIFFALFMTLLRGKKGLILAEDNGTLGELEQWVKEGLDTLPGLQQFWSAAVFQNSAEDADVGILSFQTCSDLLMTGLEDFLKEVAFVVILESSNMLIGGQEAIQTLAENISCGTKGCTWLLCDWNAESMLDLFSHLLKSELTYVSATPAGARETMISYWDVESEPNSIWSPARRFLGLEAGIIEVAGKNGVSCVNWYGADCMPVTDIGWIIAQYYRLYSERVSRPVDQKNLGTQIQCHISGIPHSMIPENFLIVEDSCCNLYETGRQYITRGREKAYVHVISPNYLLRDFMKYQDEVMRADPKYIAQLVPEYMNSVRNACLHLLRRLLKEEVLESEIYAQLKACETPPPFAAGPAADFCAEDAIREIVKTLLGLSIDTGIDLQIRTRQVFHAEKARMLPELRYRITGKKVQQAFLKYFRQARYVDETGEKKQIGKLMLAGHLELKYLPGQFVTMHGKYYQVERILDSNSEMLLSLIRASDRVEGRYCYRQIRSYQVEGANNEPGEMVFSRFGLCVRRLSLNFTAQTTGYLTLKKGWNTFVNAEEFSYPGIPRHYWEKQVLRVDLPLNAMNRSSFIHLAAIIHDMFFTFFPQYCHLLSVAVPWNMRDREERMLYHGVLSSLSIGGETEAQTAAEAHDTADVDFTEAEPSGEAHTDREPDADGGSEVNSFYIFEDCCEDLGLLRSIERHFPRILEIAAEYTEWEQQNQRSYFS